MSTPRRAVGLTWILAALLSSPARAEHGVTAQEIILGQSCALEGPARSIGASMRAGLLAAFAEQNAAGGVNGRRIRLISKNDGYEPAQAIKNTRALIEEEDVFLLIGEVGTPTSRAVITITKEEQIPFFGPFTGAGFLRDPSNLVINVRGSYDQEMERLAQYLVEEKGLERIACFYQNDGYGQAGLNGIKKALERRNMKLVATGHYLRNTVAVKSALLKIRRAEPQAIVMVGAYKPCATFIKTAKAIGLDDVVFCNISFVGTKALMQALGKEGEGTIISQVVKFPWDQSIPLIRDYHKAMGQYQPDSEIGFVSLEGYLVGKFFIRAALSVKDELTRESFVDTIVNTGTYDLGGFNLKYGKGDLQGMNEVFLTVIKDQKIHPIESWLIMKSKSILEEN